MQKQFRVLVALDWQFRAVREIITGILDYASRKTDWDVRLYGNDPESGFSIFNPGWHPDGIIGNLDHLDPNHERPRITARHNIYFSSTIKPRTTRAARWILADNQAVGRAAAETLLKRKFPHYGFVGSLKDTEWSDERYAAFSACLSEHGHETLRYKTDDTVMIDWRAERESLGRWLSDLPHPCAIFAANDARARHVIETCRFIHLTIPEQIAVLGTDNDEILCELSNPTLSSLELDFAEGGRIGAKILDRMMRGETGEIPLVSHYGLRRIIDRASTADIHGVRRTVSLACEYIRRHANDPELNLATIAATLSCSSRYLQKCFKAVHSHSVLDEIHTVRLEHVSRLLKCTRLPIDALATQSGFASPSTLTRLFKQSYGMTMSDYRRQTSYPRIVTN